MKEDFERWQIYIPKDIVFHILTFTRRNQLAVCSLVSKLWHLIASDPYPSSFAFSVLTVIPLSLFFPLPKNYLMRLIYFGWCEVYSSKLYCQNASYFASNDFSIEHLNVKDLTFDTKNAKVGRREIVTVIQLTIKFTDSPRGWHRDKRADL